MVKRWVCPDHGEQVVKLTDGLADARCTLCGAPMAPADDPQG